MAKKPSASTRSMHAGVGGGAGAAVTVADRAPEAVAVAQLDIDPHVAALEEAGRQQVGDHAGVVHGRAVVIGLDVLGAVEVEHPADRRRRRAAERADRLQPGWSRDRLVGHVEPDHGERHARLEHHVRGVGVGVDVELGRRRDVAEAERAPHGDDLAHVGEDARVLDDGERDVGEGAERRQRDRLRRRRERVHEIVHRMGRLGRAARLRQVGAVDPRFSVDVLRAHRLAHHGPRAAGIDRHLGAARQIPDPARVVLGPGQRHVAGDGGDAEQVEFLGAREGEQQGDGVVLAGVAIDDQRSCAHGGPESYLAWPASDSA